MKILIVRHAEPDYSVDSLTECGFKEAEALAEKLSKQEILDIYSSPCGRALRTAEATASKLNMNINVLDWLTEFQGKIVVDESRKSIPWNLEPRFWSEKKKLYDINSWLDEEFILSDDVFEKYNYVVDGFDMLLKKYGYERDGIIYKCDYNSEQTIVLFCHFALGMVLVSHLTGISPVLLWQSLFLPTSSVTTFVTEERVKGEVVFKCMQMGDTSHLYKKDINVSKSGLFPEIYGEEGAGPQL